MDIQKILKEIKIKENLSQKEIAEKLGIPASYISDMIAGRKIISGKTIRKFESTFPYCFTNSMEQPLLFDNTFENRIETKSNITEISLLNKTIDILRENLERKDKQIDQLFDLIKGLGGNIR